MIISENTSLLPYNTFGLNIFTKYFAEYNSVNELIQLLETKIVQSYKMLHIGLGSNLLFLNDFDGIILHSAINNIEILTQDENSVRIEVGAGLVWDDFVEYAVENNWFGIENLSLIPGEVGAAAVQNIGAYGMEVKDVIQSVNVVEIASKDIKRISLEKCAYDYRSSIFKRESKGKFIITSVVMQLSKKPAYKLDYSDLKNEVIKFGEINLNNIRNTIIRIRKEKLPDHKEFGNAGSYFMNPIVSKEKFKAVLNLYPALPHYFVSDSQEKISAAWLIDQCGWKTRQEGKVAVHPKQALVIINKGGATGTEISTFAAEIQSSVFEKFGIEIIPEVNYIE